jgi:glycosyltransferase involved in cell wall biosynthesis
MEKRYKEAFSFLRGKTQTIFNGFDGEDIPNPSSELFDKFTLLHLGNLHLDLNLSYPILFLESIQKMKDDKLINASNFQVLIIGERYETFDRKISDLGISELVKCLGRLPHEEAIAYLRKSHLLLLIVETEGVITSKVFEYLATGKPVLALIKGGELMDFIQEFSPNSHVVTRYNSKDIITAISESFCNPAVSAGSGKKCQNFRRAFNRKELTKQLAETLDAFKI